MPDLGVGSTRLSVWFAEPGDHVYEGDRLVEIMMEGATFDISSPATGRLIDRLAFPDDVLRPGQVLGTVAPDRGE